MSKEAIISTEDIQSRITLQPIFEEILQNTLASIGDLPKSHSIPIALQDYSTKDVFVASSMTDGHQSLVNIQSIGKMKNPNTFLNFVDTLAGKTNCQAIICQSSLYEAIINDEKTTIKKEQGSKSVIRRKGKNIILVKEPFISKPSPNIVH